VVAPNQALQQTAGHDSFLRPLALQCPAAAELDRSAAEGDPMATHNPHLMTRLVGIQQSLMAQHLGGRFSFCHSWE